MNNVTVLSDNYNKAVELTQRIRANAQAAQNSMLDVCRAIAQMRDGKLYKELGYQNFADYCENELNIHRNQGIKYARIGTTLTEENAQLLGISDTLGAEKLYLLSMFEPEDRQEAAAEAGTLTVAELKKKLDDAKERNIQLEKQVSELESRPVDIAVEPDTAAIDALNRKHAAELEKLQEKHRSELEAINEKLTEIQEQAVSAPEAAAPTATKETFKAFLANVADSFSRLIAFVEKHKDDTEISLYISKVSQLRDIIDGKLRELDTDKRN